MDDRAYLMALQLGDSLFPSGAYTLSSGLETLVADGVVGPEELGVVLEVFLEERLAWADLPATLGAHDAWHVRDLPMIETVDHCLSAAKISREEREGSQRSGRRLAIEANRILLDATIDNWIASISAGTTPGNLAVAQGLAGAASGIGRRETALLAAYSLAALFSNAATKLLRVGHGTVQSTIATAHPVILRALAQAERCTLAEMAPSTPEADIASARHEVADVRMFGS